MGESNPLDTVMFWGQPDGPGPIQQELTSSILPSDYEVGGQGAGGLKVCFGFMRLWSHANSRS